MPTGSSVFGFPEFLTAVTLLVLVFSTGDSRYRFRMEVAPFHLPRVTFFAILAIGFGSLLVDVWYAEDWPTLTGPVGQAGLQAGLGLIFLALLVVWIVIAFIGPPRFNRWTAKHFYTALVRRVLKGEEADMAMAADELAPSMAAIVKTCPPILRRIDPKDLRPIRDVEACANDILLLMGNARFCRQLVRASPVTAMALFDAMAAQHKHHLPVRALVQNLVREALKNRDSLLYDEAEEFSSDFVGYAKPFTSAVFGHFETVDGLSEINASPTDLQMISLQATAIEYRVYRAACLVFIDAFLASGAGHSRAVDDIFRSFEGATRDAYELSDVNGRYWGTDAYDRIEVTVRFVGDVVTRLGEARRLPTGRAKMSRGQFSSDLYDQLADLMFEVILNVASVEGEPDRTWGVQHNAVWGRFFGAADGDAWRQVRRRLIRRFHLEISDMEQFANFKSARALGYFLNVMGLREVGRNAAKREARGFHRLLLAWFATHYLTLARDYPDVAKACLIGGISFDEAGSRLVKTYAKLTRPEPTRRVLALDPARAEPWDHLRDD